MLRDVFDFTLSDGWDLYWFQAEHNTFAETEMADLRTRENNLALDPSLAEVAGWGSAE